MKRTTEHNLKIAEAHLALRIGKSPTKTCPRCKQILPRTVFQRRKGGKKDGLSFSYCPPCHKEYARERSRKYWVTHPEKRPEQKLANRKVKLKRFGLTIAEFEEMVQLQQRRCAICNDLPNRENLDIDHDHKTGKVRGLLCSACNRAIGYMGDNPERLIKAANYLTNKFMSEEIQEEGVEQPTVTVTDVPGDNKPVETAE